MTDFLAYIDSGYSRNRATKVGLGAPGARIHSIYNTSHIVHQLPIETMLASLRVYLKMGAGSQHAGIEPGDVAA